MHDQGNILANKRVLKTTNYCYVLLLLLSLMIAIDIATCIAYCREAEIPLLLRGGMDHSGLGLGLGLGLGIVLGLCLTS